MQKMIPSIFSSFVHRFPGPCRAVLAMAALTLVTLVSAGDLFYARKAIALLLMPAGLLWLALLAPACLARTRRLRVAAILAFAGYTISGSPLTGGALMSWLESPFQEIWSAGDGPPLDALLVLGGGSQASGSGHVHLGQSGDRILQAARIYRAGGTRTLVASGSSVASGRNLAEETAAIWRELGIPRRDIVLIPGPRNTAEEIAAFQDLAATKDGWDRLGICTSAWHLRRAMARAETSGLDATPIPADFRGQTVPLRSPFLIPQGDGFSKVGRACWEILGLASGA